MRTMLSPWPLLQAKGRSENLEKPRQYFEQALGSDPLYAPAYAELADYYSVLPFYTNAKSDEVFPKAKAAVARVLRCRLMCTATMSE